MLKKILIIAVVFGAILYGIWQLSAARSYQVFGDLVHRVDTDKKVVALTFDDGPSKRFTNDVLIMLAAEQVQATFFITGKETKQNLSQARQLLEAGHQLGNHSYSHRRMLFMSPGAIASEIEQTDALIREAGFNGEILFRPPYGKKLLILPWYLQQHNRMTIMWDLEPESDPALANNAQAMAEYVINHTKPGSIILLHVMYQSRQASREALPLVIKGLKRKGYRFVTVAELLAIETSSKPD